MVVGVEPSLVWVAVADVDPLSPSHESDPTSPFSSAVVAGSPLLIAPLPVLVEFTAPSSPVIPPDTPAAFIRAIASVWVSHVPTLLTRGRATHVVLPGQGVTAH